MFFPLFMSVVESVAELYYLFHGRFRVEDTIPLIGLDIEQITYRNLKFQVWDLRVKEDCRYALFNYN